MAILEFDKNSERLYETGVKKCVLFVKSGSGYGTGVAWNGVTAITESPSGAEPTALYADDIKYLNLLSNEEFGATIEAYMSPEEFDVCDGTVTVGKVKFGQGARSEFALCYRTVLGNDTSNNAYGYKLHIIYGCLAAPTERAYSTINDSPEAMTLSWEVSTTPVKVANHNPTSTVTIVSTEVDANKLKALEDLIYGTESTNSTYPSIEKIYEIMSA